MALSPPDGELIPLARKTLWPSLSNDALSDEVSAACLAASLSSFALPCLGGTQLADGRRVVMYGYTEGGTLSEELVSSASRRWLGTVIEQ
jgi:hypothetical protein